jgi:threonine aldolase
VAHRHGLKLHMDGARFANAAAALGCSAAEMSWKAGVDVLSFGATKNGALAAEAVVFFDQALMVGAAERRKRAGMLWSKQRFLAAQWQAYLADGLWLRLAGAANARAKMLGTELGQLPACELVYPVEANEVFVRMPNSVLDRLEADGFQFYRYGGGVIRLVASFATTEADVRKLLAAVRNYVR